MEKNILHRKERLIITTLEIIDELGILGLSTREIARRQGVSEATLFRHYKSKNELLCAVLEFSTKFDLELFESVKLKDLKPKEAILYFVSSQVEYYENYPAITSVILLFDVLRYEPELRDKVDEIFNKRNNLLKILVEEGQRVGQLPSNVDSDKLADMIIGLCSQVCLKWRFQERMFSLKERTVSTLESFLEAYTQLQE